MSGVLQLRQETPSPRLRQEKGIEGRGQWSESWLRRGWMHGSHDITKGSGGSLPLFCPPHCRPRPQAPQDGTQQLQALSSPLAKYLQRCLTSRPHTTSSRREQASLGRSQKTGTSFSQKVQQTLLHVSLALTGSHAYPCANRCHRGRGMPSG